MTTPPTEPIGDDSAPEQPQQFDQQQPPGQYDAGPATGAPYPGPAGAGPAGQYPAGQVPAAPYPPIAAPGAAPAGPGYAYPAGPGYAPMPPAPPKKSRTPLIVALVVGVVLVVAIVAIGALAFIGRAANSVSDAITSATATPSSAVDRTAIGDCVRVNGTEMNTDVTAIDCADTSAVSFIVGDKQPTSDACKTAGYEYYYTEYGGSGTDKALCLIANYRVGTCYEESTLGLGIDLKEVSCDQSSGAMTIRYQITERVDSQQVPRCSDPDKQKKISHLIHTDPARPIGFCAEILGDYIWQR
ncbi:hypothetical protein MYK68_12025 [Gordonia sp. PP30]|uniref:LppU/SCO3897 family protein n=1 Tax=Gordonia sp. PP30 TaxID=2935861 RepID=UPI001FFF62D6|nr:hypothetical protein [Gordonia sp. PP30]UQE73484.1 hypothetical protein MYK68_12025 [Gordonia sp. PP30]